MESTLTVDVLKDKLYKPLISTIENEPNGDLNMVAEHIFKSFDIPINEIILDYVKFKTELFEHLRKIVDGGKKFGYYEIDFRTYYTWNVPNEFKNENIINVKNDAGKTLLQVYIDSTEVSFIPDLLSS